jgi:hypothetical protein
MKQQEIIPFLENFLIDHAERHQIEAPELKKWVAKWNNGVNPDRNELYSCLSIMKSFLKFEQKDIYCFDQKKIEEFFTKHTERSKEFKAKRAKA